MEKYLFNKAKKGEIDFIKIPLDWGLSYNEFLLFSFTTNRFSRIFYDGKYREDRTNVDKLITYLNDKKEKLKDGLNDRGLYSTKNEYAELQKQSDFIEKYKYFIGRPV